MRDAIVEPLSLPILEQGMWSMTGVSVVIDKFQVALELFVLGKGKCLEYIITERCAGVLNFHPKEAAPLGVTAW